MAQPRRRRASRGSRPSPKGNKAPALEPIDLPPGDRAGRRHDLHRRGAGSQGRARQRTDGRHDFRRLERRAGRPLHLGQPDLHRASPRAGQISAALGRSAADADPGGPDPQAGYRPATGSRCFARGSGLPAGDKYRRGARRAGQGIPGGPRPQGRRDRRRRHDRSAQPRRRILRAADHHQHGARQAPPGARRAAQICDRRCRRRAAVDVGERPQGRRDEGRRRQGRDRDADDGRLHQICEREPLLERPARAGGEPDRAARRRAGRQLSHRPRISGADRLQRRRADDRSAIRSTGRRSSTAARKCACAAFPARPIRWA